MKTIEFKGLWKLTRIVSFIFMIVLFACSSENPTLTTVKEFVKQHPEYGNVNSSTEMPNWESGKRLQIKTDNGDYLFYLIDKDVVGVDKYLENGQREKIFKKETTQSKTATETSVDKNIPEYKILFQVDLMSGAGKFGEILINSYSKGTPKEERESTLRKIIKKEGFVSAMLYSTEEAYKANSSESFSKAHPNALEKGYLGQITEKGIFVE
jgi:hypothetical protein